MSSAHFSLLNALDDRDRSVQEYMDIACKRSYKINRVFFSNTLLRWGFAQILDGNLVRCIWRFSDLDFSGSPLWLLVLDL